MANRHLSYDEFKNIFGDLGITEWVKYNWLDNNFNLPSNLVRVEYVVFDGAYININLPTTLTDIWKQDAVVAYLTTEGQQGSGADFGWYFGCANGYFVNTTVANTMTPAAPADTNVHNFVSVVDGTKADNYIYIDGVYHTSRRLEYTPGSSFCIGGISSNSQYFSHYKFYSLKIYKNDELVKSFIPVFDSATGKYGIYDLVEKQFWGATDSAQTITGPYANAVKLADISWSGSQSYQGGFWATITGYVDEQRYKAQLSGNTSFSYVITNNVYANVGQISLAVDGNYEVRAMTTGLTMQKFIDLLGDSYLLY